jgi:hypothetical protein
VALDDELDEPFVLERRIALDLLAEPLARLLPTGPERRRVGVARRNEGVDVSEGGRAEPDPRAGDVHHAPSVASDPNSQRGASHSGWSR